MVRVDKRLYAITVSNSNIYSIVFLEVSSSRQFCAGAYANLNLYQSPKSHRKFQEKSIKHLNVQHLRWSWFILSIAQTINVVRNCISELTATSVVATYVFKNHLLQSYSISFAIRKGLTTIFNLLQHRLGRTISSFLTESLWIVIN